MKTTRAVACAFGFALALAGQPASAKVAAAEAATLGASLTPAGAEKAGNKDGTIPAWTGGTPQHGSPKGEYTHDAAIDAESPLFTITRDNLAQYAAQLTEGHKELFKRYADYKMTVYPSHRTVGFPDAINQATAANAAVCELGGTDAPDHCRLGFPYPIPQSGAEVIWNHKLRWRGNFVLRYNNQFIVQPSGDYQQTKVVEQAKFYYANIPSPGSIIGGAGAILSYLSQTLAPPRLAGNYLLVHDLAGIGDAGRIAWLYNTGLKRVRRAPSVAYDTAYEGTDGNEFYDQVDMFNGALNLYDWKLIGKKELYLPYNSNRISGNKVKFADLIRPHHLNQDLPRYELHRYWVVEAQLRAGSSHTFKTRRFYVDEDSWNIEAIDCYDNHDQLYKFQEGHLGTDYVIHGARTVPEIIYDFASGRYFITAAANEDKPNDPSVNFGDDFFTPESLQRSTSK